MRENAVMMVLVRVGVGRVHDAEMCPCAIERAVSVEKKLTCRGMGYIFRMINV